MRGGLSQPGGKVLLFDEEDEPVDPAIVRRCLDQQWVEPWQAGEHKPHSVFLACRLTPLGRRLTTEERDLAPGVAGAVSGISSGLTDSVEREQSSKMLLEALEVMYRRERSGWRDISGVRKPVILGSVLVSLLAMMIVVWQTPKLFSSPDPAIPVTTTQQSPEPQPVAVNQVEPEPKVENPAEPPQTETAPPSEIVAADTSTEVSLIPLSGISELDNAAEVPEIAPQQKAAAAEPSIQATPPEVKEALSEELPTPAATEGAISPEAVQQVQIDQQPQALEKPAPAPVLTTATTTTKADQQIVALTTALSNRGVENPAPGTFVVVQSKGPLVGEPVNEPFVEEVVAAVAPPPKVNVQVAVLPLIKPDLPDATTKTPLPETQLSQALPAPAILPAPATLPVIKPSAPSGQSEVGLQVVKVEKAAIETEANVAQSGGFIVQFGAFRIKEGAAKFHAQLLRSYGDTFDAVPVSLEPLGPPDANGLHMVRSGRIGSRSAAITLCQKIQAAGDDCFVFASTLGR